MRYPKLRELKEAIKALIKGPYTTKFPKVPHKPFPRFRGKPVPYEKGCIGCGACAIVCPPQSITITDVITENPPIRYLRWRHDYCIFCGQCDRLCTSQEGVKLSNEFDLADIKRDKMYDEIKKELVLCSECGEIIAPKDQLLFTYKKLLTMTYSNINLIDLTQRELLGNINAVLSDTSQPLRRQSSVKLLCPKCRHIVWVFDDSGR